MKALGNEDAKVHIFAATALVRGKAPSHTLSRLYRGTHLTGVEGGSKASQYKK